MQQEFFYFAPDAFCRQVVERKRAAKSRCPGLEGELEARGELDRSQRTQAIVCEGLRIDGAQQASLEITDPTRWRLS